MRKGVTGLEFELSLFGGGFNQALLERQAVGEVMRYNDFTAKYGLVLTEQQAIALVQTRGFALKQTGRIEFGGGIIDKMILAFCDSPFLSMRNYEEVLHELIEIFYYYKNETRDLISDDALIGYMKKSFDGICHGSLDLLSGRELHGLAQQLRMGNTGDNAEEETPPEEEEENGEY